MTPTPTAVGMALCDYVILEEGTRKVSPIGIFDSLAVEGFPSEGKRFFVFSMLTDAQGLGRIRVTINRLSTGEAVYSRGGSIHFPDRLMTVNYRIPVSDCSFPAAGWYVASLFVDDELVAHRRFEVRMRGAPHAE